MLICFLNESFECQLTDLAISTILGTDVVIIEDVLLVKNVFHVIYLKNGNTKPWISKCTLEGKIVNKKNQLLFKNCAKFSLENLPKNERIRMRPNEDLSKIWVYYMMKTRKRIESYVADFSTKKLSSL